MGVEWVRGSALFQTKPSQAISGPQVNNPGACWKEVGGAQSGGSGLTKALQL